MFLVFMVPRQSLGRSSVTQRW